MKSQVILLAAFTLFLNCAFAGDGVEALEKGDYETAYREFLPLAEKGDTRSIIQIGMFYHQGQGVKQDYSKAMDWYLKAFKKNNGDAFNNIGVMYRDGLGVEKNLQIAYALFWITYWSGLGDDETQIRNGHNLDKTAALMKPAEAEEAVRMTGEYVVAYVEKRGKLDEKEQALKFSKTGHVLKEMANLNAPSAPHDMFILTREIRVLKELSPGADAKIEFVTDSTASSSPVDRRKADCRVTTLFFRTPTRFRKMRDAPLSWSPKMGQPRFLN
jgi:hypothetical protein